MTGKRTGTEILVGATAAILMIAGPALAANQQRVRAMAGSQTGTPGMASNLPGTNHPAASGKASSEPRSFSEYMKLIRDGGQLTGGPLVNKTFREPAPREGRIVNGSKGNLAGCPPARTKLPCGLYDDPVVFETEQGPFSRSLGNLEDYELTNPGAGSLCVTDDGTKDPDIDCRASPDPTGFFCAGNGIDAGDILTGVANDNTPSRGAGWWEMLVIGAGFQGNSSKYVLANYFGDTNDITFPNSATPTGCQNASPGPNVVGFDYMNPFASSGSTVTVTMANGVVAEFGTKKGKSDGVFFGLCCDSEITKIEILDNDGTTTGVDNVKWGQVKNPCPVSYVPLTLDDIFAGIECLEMKLDTGGSGAST